MRIWSRPHPVLLLVFVGVSAFALGMAAERFLAGNQGEGPKATRPATPPTVALAFNPAFYPFTIYDAEPPRIALPSLRELTHGVGTDDEAISRVLAFYREHRRRLARAWGEDNLDRLKALFAMYVIHLSHPYGPAENPLSFLRYVRESSAAHCGMYGMFQSRLLDGFGLPWRYVAVSSGEHGWIEVKIEDSWEIFDATANLWIDQSAFILLEGRPRRYYVFYTPWSDVDRPNVRWSVDGKPEPIGGTPGTLRTKMVGLGIYYLNEQQRRERRLSVQIWKNFMPPIP